MNFKEQIIDILDRYSYIPAEKKIVYEEDFGQIADEIIEKVADEIIKRLIK